VSAIRRPQIGTVLLVALVALLAAGVVKRAVTVADASGRLRSELALFGRYEHGLAGRFLPAHQRRQLRGGDLVCAPHRAPGPHRRGSHAVADYNLCAVIGGSPNHLRLVRAYRTKAR
jgi:hypothetical protein